MRGWTTEELTGVGDEVLDEDDRRSRRPDASIASDWID